MRGNIWHPKNKLLKMEHLIIYDQEQMLGVRGSGKSIPVIVLFLVPSCSLMYPRKLAILV